MMEFAKSMVNAAEFKSFDQSHPIQNACGKSNIMCIGGYCMWVNFFHLLLKVAYNSKRKQTYLYAYIHTYIHITCSSKQS